MELCGCGDPDLSKCLIRPCGDIDPEVAFVRDSLNPGSSGIFSSTRFRRSSDYFESVLTAYDIYGRSFTLSTCSPHVSVYPCRCDATYYLLATRDIVIEPRSAYTVVSDVRVRMSSGLTAHIVDELPARSSVVLVWGDVPPSPGFVSATLLNRSTRPITICAHVIYGRLIIE